MGKKMTDRQHDKIIEITKEIYIKLQKKKKLYSIIDRVFEIDTFCHQFLSMLTEEEINEDVDRHV